LLASLRKPPTTDEYTPLAELLTPPVATAAVLLASLSAAETAGNCHWQVADTANSNRGVVASLRKPPTTDEYTTGSY
jgi:hypothetical protein